MHKAGSGSRPLLPGCRLDRSGDGPAESLRCTACPDTALACRRHPELVWEVLFHSSMAFTSKCFAVGWRLSEHLHGIAFRRPDGCPPRRRLLNGGRLSTCSCGPCVECPIPLVLNLQARAGAAFVAKGCLFNARRWNVPQKNVCASATPYLSWPIRTTSSRGRGRGLAGETGSATGDGRGLQGALPEIAGVH